jgi:hypothetical protein
MFFRWDSTKVTFWLNNCTLMDQNRGSLYEAAPMIGSAICLAAGRHAHFNLFFSNLSGSGHTKYFDFLI